MCPFWPHFSLCVFKSVFPFVSLVLSHSPISLHASLSLHLSPSPVWFLCISRSWSPSLPPLLGPGHPSEGAPPVFDDPRHSRLLLCLHAPSLDTPQLNRLRLWTLAGQRHGESGHFLAEVRGGGWTPGVACKASRQDLCFPQHPAISE